MPATAISWACYESFKHFLVRDRGRLSDNDGGGGNDGSVITSAVDVSSAGVPSGDPERADSNSNKVIINIAGVGSGVGAGSTTPTTLHPSNPNSSDLPETMTASAMTRTPATTSTTLKPGLKPLPCKYGLVFLRSGRGKADYKIVGRGRLDRWVDGGPRSAQIVYQGELVERNIKRALPLPDLFSLPRPSSISSSLSFTLSFSSPSILSSSSLGLRPPSPIKDPNYRVNPRSIDPLMVVVVARWNRSWLG